MSYGHLVIGENVKLGSRFLDGKIQHRETWEEEDKERNLSEEDVTFKIIQSMANQILDFLEFTGEYCKDGNKIACLDTQFWIGTPEEERRWFPERKTDREIPGGEDPAARKPTVLYQFFKKPMANRLTILKRSAVPEQIKVTTMVSETI